MLNRINLLFKRRGSLATGTFRSRSRFDFEPRPPLNANASQIDILIFLLFSFILFSCTTSTPLATPQLVTVYSTSAAQPWLTPLYACAGSLVVISRVDDASSAAIVLRVGEPQFLSSSAYQIDTEEILIVTHRQSPVQNLTLNEARALFAGQGDPTVQLWVYASGEDVQNVFDQFVMAGRGVAPAARLAVNPQQMSDTLVNESDAVGILPRRWKTGDTREVLPVATVPVLAITNSEAKGVIEELIACLQK
ncbi:MAG TPA: hypothetical protein VMN99_11745 [Anaerolineales bacterium]|nr:hypothetical protein [Anaerolineales bacterium]